MVVVSRGTGTARVNQLCHSSVVSYFIFKMPFPLVLLCHIVLFFMVKSICCCAQGHSRLMLFAWFLVILHFLVHVFTANENGKSKW